MLRHWGRLSSDPSTPVQFRCFHLLHPSGIAALSHSHSQLGAGVSWVRLSLVPLAYVHLTAISFLLWGLAAFQVVAPGSEIGTLCPLTYLSLPLTPGRVSLGAEGNPPFRLLWEPPLPWGLLLNKGRRTNGSSSAFFSITFFPRGKEEQKQVMGTRRRVGGREKKWKVTTLGGKK